MLSSLWSETHGDTVISSLGWLGGDELGQCRSLFEIQRQNRITFSLGFLRLEPRHARAPDHGELPDIRSGATFAYQGNCHN
jgi:hypothetical protein